MGLFIHYNLGKIPRKTNIFQGLKNVSFSVNFAKVLNEFSL